jgi:hypothetical protein
MQNGMYYLMQNGIKERKQDSKAVKVRKIKELIE